MLYAYGATVIEIVRRKEFGERYTWRSVLFPHPVIVRFFAQRAQVVAEMLAKLT